jgi:DNA-binding XRE family transcriptional regulator
MTQTTQLRGQPDVPVPTGPRKSHAPKRWIIVLDGQRVRSLRCQRGLSQRALADQAGISLTTVVRLERQRRSPCRPWTLGALAAALGEQPTDMRAAGARVR